LMGVNSSGGGWRLRSARMLPMKVESFEEKSKAISKGITRWFYCFTSKMIIYKNTFDLRAVNAKFPFKSLVDSCLTIRRISFACKEIAWLVFSHLSLNLLDWQT
jgi:hypothetical protein